MKLRELEPQFLTYEKCSSCEYHAAGGEHHLYVDTIAAAAGIMFLCPKCWVANGGPIGTHSVLCWFVGKVPDEAFPRPGRWIPQGTGIDDLTFVSGPGCPSCSVLLIGGCAWHGFVRAGEVLDA